MNSAGGLHPRTQGRRWAVLPPCPFGPSRETGLGWLAVTALQLAFTLVVRTQLSWAGFPVRFRVTAFCPMHGSWQVVRLPGVGHASQVHLLGGNCTHTVLELSGTGVPATVTRSLAVRLAVNGSHQASSRVFAAGLSCLVTVLVAVASRECRSAVACGSLSDRGVCDRSGRPAALACYGFLRA